MPVENTFVELRRWWFFVCALFGAQYVPFQTHFVTVWQLYSWLQASTCMRISAKIMHGWCQPLYLQHPRCCVERPCGAFSARGRSLHHCRQRKSKRKRDIEVSKLLRKGTVVLCSHEFHCGILYRAGRPTTYATRVVVVVTWLSVRGALRVHHVDTIVY